ncbi:hypothetical protein IMAU10031_01191 [Lactobacillus helveticus]|nr:hypothetical protein [Lactobacillus helveticus]
MKSIITDIVKIIKSENNIDTYVKQQAERIAIKLVK